ncbi:hypothetical protein B0H13DRAFT_2576829 [Mycena leptocephala]|nr:hypothetical protein B0H13DRAFT_2576829 [Mycena leptocephala]
MYLAAELSVCPAEWEKNVKPTLAKMLNRIRKQASHRAAHETAMQRYAGMPSEDFQVVFEEKKRIMESRDWKARHKLRRRTGFLALGVLRSIHHGGLLEEELRYKSSPSPRVFAFGLSTPPFCAAWIPDPSRLLAHRENYSTRRQHPPRRCLLASRGLIESLLVRRHPILELFRWGGKSQEEAIPLVRHHVGFNSRGPRRWRARMYQASRGLQRLRVEKNDVCQIPPSDGAIMATVHHRWSRMGRFDHAWPRMAIGILSNNARHTYQPGCVVMPIGTSLARASLASHPNRLSRF